MDLATLYEIIGYVASALVAVSLMMRSILKLRVINLVGAVAFVIYGLLIHAYPVALVNFIIVLINLYYLYGFSRAQERFTVLDVPPDAPYLQHVLGVHGDEIRRVAPGFRPPTDAAPSVTSLLLRDETPAGVFVAGRAEEGTWRVHLDFVLPGYRDFKLGRYLYDERREAFLARGIQRFFAEPGTAEHAEYLRRMGFMRGDDGRFWLELVPAR